MKIFRCENKDCKEVGNDYQAPDVIQYQVCYSCGDTMTFVPKIGFSPSELQYEDITEFMRVRDKINELSIELRGICDDHGALICEQHILEATRSLQTIIYNHYNVGD